MVRASRVLVQRVLLLTALTVAEHSAAFVLELEYDLNGSVMIIGAAGQKLRVSYKVPREGLLQEGVATGTVQFEGIVTDSQFVHGTAYVFSRRCGSRGYAVRGRIQPKELFLEGRRPLLGQDCSVAAYRDAFLKYSWLGNTGNGQPIAPHTPQSEILICSQPVPRTIAQMIITLKGASALDKAAAKNHIAFLMNSFCRRVANADVVADSDEYLQAGCIMYSGSFRGERVFWGQCDGEHQLSRFLARYDTNAAVNVVIDHDSGRITLKYLWPSANDASHGVEDGMYLYTGLQKATGLHGFAFDYSKTCGTVTFPASLSYSQDREGSFSISVSGNLPIRGSDCRIVRYDAVSKVVRVKDEEVSE